MREGSHSAGWALAVVRAGGRDVLLISYLFTATDPPVDGEVFSARIVDVAGTVVAERPGPVSYDSVSPNGEACGDTCRSGSLP